MGEALLPLPRSHSKGDMDAHSSSTMCKEYSAEQQVAMPAILGGLTRGRCCNRVNITLGPKEERLLMTGLHTVADIYCTCCNTTLGWKYVRH